MPDDMEEYPKAHYEFAPLSTEIADGVIWRNVIIVGGQVFGSHHSTEADAVAEALDLATELLGESTADWLKHYDGWVVDPSTWGEAVHEQFAVDERCSYHDVAVREVLYT